MKKSRMLAIAVAVGAMSLLVAQVAPPPTPPSPPSDGADDAQTDGQDWELVSVNVAAWDGAAGGGSNASLDGGWIMADLFLLNKRSGKAYVFLGNCTGSNTGCFGAIPVFEEGDGPLTATPRPQTGSASGRSR